MDADRAEESDDHLVQLGHVQVASERLRPGGHGLWSLLGPPAGLDLDIPDEHRAMLPERGWRLIHELELPHGVQQTFAAPRPDAGWAVVGVFDRGTGRTVSADPGPLFVVPGRATRRAALHLSWPAPITIAPGEVPELTVRLRNTSGTRWVNRADDAARVAGWVLDLAGNPVPGSSPWIVSGGHRPLPDLDPDDAVMLPVAIEAPRLEELPAGRYGLDAVLTSLDLHAVLGVLRVD